MTRRRDERGVAVPWGMALLGLLAFMTLALSVIGGAVVTRRHAQSGADLAALAGAVALQRQQDACVEVSSSADANHVEVVVCEVEGETVTVTVKRDTAEVFGRRLTIEAKARAGPR